MTEFASDTRFQTTRWTVVLKAGGENGHGQQAAVDMVCRLYGRPLFVFCLRSGYRIPDAEDLTQGFFAFLLSRGTLGFADPRRGKFRTFLLTSFKHYMSDEWDRNRAIKRGGGRTLESLDSGLEHLAAAALSEDVSPEQAFDRQWAADVVERAVAALRSEQDAAGRARWFDMVAGRESALPYGRVALEIGTTEEAVKSYAKRVRRRFRELIEQEVAATAGSPEDATDEMAYLCSLLRG